MTIELQDHLIGQLTPLLKEEHFQEAFESLTSDESTSTRFLIKMELHRIAEPCDRPIDLRDRSDLPCEEFEYKSQTHFLDEPAKTIFESNTVLFNEEYTIGVYERVHDSFKTRRQQQNENLDTNTQDESQENNLLVPGIVLGNYANRSEIRLAATVKVTGLQLNGINLEGNTLDISVNGAKVKLSPANQLNLSKPIHIKYHLDESNHLFDDLINGVDYDILGHEEPKEGEAILKLKRKDTSAGITNLLESFMAHYKKKHKLDVADIYHTSVAMGLERQYLPNLPHLPIFISSKHNEPFLSHILLCQKNQPVLNYFFDENEKSQLTCMLTATRLRRIITEPKNTDHQILFSFTHQAKGSVHFYSATLAELKAKKMMPLFLGFGSKKNGWRIFRASCQKVDHRQPYKNAHMALDDTAYSEMTEHKLSRISHILQLIDYTQPSAATQYQGWLNDQEVNKLKIFAQHKVRSHQAQLVSMQFNERRAEARFAFKTLVTLIQGDKRCHAVTQNISGRGMQLNMEHPVEFNEREPISLSFPKLQPLAGKINLSNLPYRMVHNRKNGVTIHLAADMSQDIHVGVEFIRRLIKHNADKLEQLTETNGETKELSDGMKNLIMRKLPSVPIFVEKTEQSAKLTALGIGPSDNELTDMFAASSDNHMEFDMTPLLGEDRFNQWVLNSVEDPNGSFKTFEVFVEMARHPRGQIEVYCYPVEKIGDKEAQLAFIQRCQRNGQFRALRLYIGAAAKPDMQYIKREIDYMTIQSPQKAQQVEKMMYGLVGVGELLDISLEVQLRFPELFEVPISS